MPARARNESSEQAPSRLAPQPALRGGVGKLACTKNFHCVKAHQASVFYRVLAQLK